MDKTVAKAFRTLEALAQCEEPQGITSLSHDLGLGKSNVHRLLSTLVELGYVRPAGGGKYEATLRLWECGMNVLARHDTKRVAGPYLLEAAGTSGESAYLSLLDGYEVVYIDKVDSKHPVRAVSRIGDRAPAYAVATGKAILAFQPPEILAAHPPLHAFTERTSRTLKELEIALAKVRHDGVAFNHGEWRDGVGGVAAPIRGSDGTVTMAIGISGPRDRLKPARLRALAPIVARAGAAISAGLGYRDRGSEDHGRRAIAQEHPSSKPSRRR